jgi:hypothetical protein
MVTLTDMSIQAMERKLAIAYIVHTGSSISICLPKPLTIICLCSILSILSTKAIAFVVEFCIQYYYVDL